MTKTCKACSTEKPTSEFYAQPRSRDGLGSNCKACALEYSKQFRKNNPLKVRIYDRDRQRRLRSTPEGRAIINAKRKAQYWRSPEKTSARWKVKRALRIGTLTKGPCSVCGAQVNVQAHHRDYFKPLEVEWMCEEHHRQIHGKKVLENQTA